MMIAQDEGTGSNNANNANATNIDTNNDPWDVTAEPSWGPPNANNNTNAAAMVAWRERERRQRTIRMLMMFLLMLLLMDGEEQQTNQRRQRDNAVLRKQEQQQHKRRSALLSSKFMNARIYQHRRKQDSYIYQLVSSSSTSPLPSNKRYRQLVAMNENINIEQDYIRSWVSKQEERLGRKQQIMSAIDHEDNHTSEEDEETTLANHKEDDNNNDNDQHGVIDGKKVVFHYPWNATGFYRGEWTTITTMATPQDDNEEENNSDEEEGGTTTTTTDNTNKNQEEDESTLPSEEEHHDHSKKVQYKTPKEMESILQSILIKNKQNPNNYNMKEDTNSKDGDDDDTSFPLSPSSSLTMDMGIVCLPPKTKFKTLQSKFNVTKLQMEETQAIEQVKTKRTFDPLLFGRTSRGIRSSSISSSSHHMSTASTNKKNKQNKKKTVIKSTAESGGVYAFFAPWSGLSSETSVVDIDDEDDDESQEDKEYDPTLYKLPLTKKSGRIGLQFYSRSIPGMKELSLMDGFVKFYDSSTVGYSTRRDILLRVKGVMIHPIGKVSLVANTLTGRDAFVIYNQQEQEQIPEDTEMDGSSTTRKSISSTSLHNHYHHHVKTHEDTNVIEEDQDQEVELLDWNDVEKEVAAAVDVDIDAHEDGTTTNGKKEEQRRRLNEALSDLLYTTTRNKYVESVATSETGRLEETIRQNAMALWSFDVTQDEPDEILVDSNMKNLWEENDEEEIKYHLIHEQRNPSTMFQQMELQEYFGTIVSQISVQVKETFQRGRRRLSTVIDNGRKEEEDVNTIVNHNSKKEWIQFQDEKVTPKKKTKTVASSSSPILKKKKGTSTTTKKGKATSTAAIDAHDDGTHDERVSTTSDGSSSTNVKRQRSNGSGTSSTVQIEERRISSSTHVDKATITTSITKKKEEQVKEENSIENDYDDMKVTQQLSEKEQQVKRAMEEKEAEEQLRYKKEYSNYVFPFPYVMDDKKESIKKQKTPASRKMPQREIPLEANAGRCEFELNFDVKPVEWTVGEWRTLVQHHVHDIAMLDPVVVAAEVERARQKKEEETMNNKNKKDSKKKKTSKESSSHNQNSQHSNKKENNKVGSVAKQALVMEIVGKISSPNCDFTASVNATAVRTNWESTTGRAINYSFYMMITCLTQIVVLLRQLLHSQTQSAAVRVSLLSIGWQTVLDALLCLGHISLSLAMQPLFTAFASVAFFKLLIFCVIEMKYMAIIMQARNGGNNTTELLRRQLTMLHLRFYVALMGVLMLFFYAGEEYRTSYMLTLYSFWVPQIILNIVTEAKRPLHDYYIYGMSISRLVAPLYIFAVPNNFLKEVYPDAPNDPHMCQCLVLWIGIQTAILIAQGKYGARFMIPARFLPPKFDYSRPIPESLLPPGATQNAESEMPVFAEVDSSTSSLPVTAEVMRDHDVSPTLETASTTMITSPANDRHATRTRNRIKGNRNRANSANQSGCGEKKSSMETVIENTPPLEASPLTLDCVICYNPIDIQNRRGYMLAPCDHIFHRDCLMQWMDVKMECPICRTELPAL